MHGSVLTKLFHCSHNRSTSPFDIPIIDAIASTSIPLSYIIFATNAIPSARPFASPSSKPFASPSSMPSSRPCSFAVSNEFFMSRYALRLSSYSRNSVGVKRATAAASKSLKPKPVNKLRYRSSDCLITDCIIALGKDSAINQNIQIFTKKITPQFNLPPKSCLSLS